MTSGEAITSAIAGAALVVSMLALWMQWRGNRPRLGIRTATTLERRIISKGVYPGHVEYGLEEDALSVRLYNSGERTVHPDHIELVVGDHVVSLSVTPNLPWDLPPNQRFDTSVFVADLPEEVRDRQVRVVVTDTLGRRFRSHRFRIPRTMPAEARD